MFADRKSHLQTDFPWSCDSPLGHYLMSRTGIIDFQSHHRLPHCQVLPQVWHSLPLLYLSSSVRLYSLYPPQGTSLPQSHKEGKQQQLLAHTALSLKTQLGSSLVPPFFQSHMELSPNIP